MISSSTSDGQDGFVAPDLPLHDQHGRPYRSDRIVLELPYLSLPADEADLVKALESVLLEG